MKAIDRGNIELGKFDEVYNGSSVEKIRNILPRSLRWEIGDSIKALIAADEISRSERRVLSRNANDTYAIKQLRVAAAAARVC